MLKCSIKTSGRPEECCKKTTFRLHTQKCGVELHEKIFQSNEFLAFETRAFLFSGFKQMSVNSDPRFFSTLLVSVLVVVPKITNRKISPSFRNDDAVVCF